MRIVTFGEAMVRFSPPPDSAIEKAEQFAVHTAGAEANVAAALARLGLDSCWVSRLPRNALGRRIAAKLREHGVDASHIIWTDEGRVGLYFVEAGPPPRPPQVIYDRAHSAFSSIEANELDLGILDRADLLHLTGITPALSPSCSQVVAILVHAAVDRRVPISFDLNYRAKLWNPAEARATLEPILPHVSLFFVSRADASVVLSLQGEPEAVVRELGARFPRATVVLSAGGDGAWAWDGSVHHQPVTAGAEVDRIGRGDAFCAGYIFGSLEGGTERGLAHGAALAALAQTYAGDITWSTADDLRGVVEGNAPMHFR